MRDIIKDQLSKVKYVDVSGIKEGEPFFIKKRIPTNFELNKEYIIELNDDLLIKGKNDILESNFNHGRVPKDKKLHGEVQIILGKMILFNGFGWNGKDKDNYWSGYLPKDKIKIIEML